MTNQYIAESSAKCAGNNKLNECNSCARKLFLVKPGAKKQVWIMPWTGESPCPNYWNTSK